MTSAILYPLSITYGYILHLNCPLFWTPLTANKGEQDIDQLQAGSSSLPPIRERSSLSPDPEAEQELEHFLDSSNKVGRRSPFREMGLKALTIFQIDENGKEWDNQSFQTRLTQLGKGSIEKKRFLSGIARIT